MKTIKNIFFIACIAAALVSCAQSAESDSYAAYNRVMAAWMNVNYPTKVSNTTDSGAYILDEEEGTGKTPTDSSYVFVHYVRTDLEGNIESTNFEELARQLMQYAHSSYYGSDIWQLGIESVPYGVEEMLLKMKEGGFAKIACPLAASEITYTAYNAFSDGSATDNVIYYLYLDKVIEDIDEYQTEQIEAFRDSVYPGLDTISAGFYFKKLVEAEIPTLDDGTLDTIADATTVYVRYIGRLLNGQVFDTNIQDTAKKYKIYSSDNDYDALEIEFYSDQDDAIDNNDVVEGFSMAVCRMYYGEVADTFFWSSLGYAESGSGESIPEYSPLRFTIWLNDSEDD